MSRSAFDLTHTYARMYVCIHILLVLTQLGILCDVAYLEGGF